MFKLEAVSKSFRGVPVLDRIDLQVTEGETTIVLGPSGSGKSTLLRLLLGLLEPDSGRVLFSGRELRREELRRIRQRIGYVIQDGGLFPHLTARANTVIMAEQLRWSSKQIQNRLAELVDLTRFPASALSRYPGEISGGERQRVALMRALMLDPQALLLDEPLGSLDPMVRYDLQEDLRRVFVSLGKTTLLVTHDLTEAAWFGDEVLIMRSGRIVQRGPLAELMEHPADEFVDRFLRAQRPPIGHGEREDEHFPSRDAHPGRYVAPVAGGRGEPALHDPAWEDETARSSESSPASSDAAVMPERASVVIRSRSKRLKRVSG